MTTIDLTALYPVDDDDLTRICDSRGHGVPDAAIAEQIGCDRRSYHPDHDRPPSRRTKSNQNPRGYSCGRPKYGNTVDRLQQRKAQPCGEKIGQCHSDGQNNVRTAYERVASQHNRLLRGSAQCASARLAKNPGA